MFILVIYKYSIYGFELLDMMCFQVLPKCYDTGPSEQGGRGGYLSPTPQILDDMSTKRANYAHHITTYPPSGFLDLPMALRREVNSDHWVDTLTIRSKVEQ